jgi:hypothetical protein
VTTSNNARFAGYSPIRSGDLDQPVRSGKRSGIQRDTRVAGNARWRGSFGLADVMAPRSMSAATTRLACRSPVPMIVWGFSGVLGPPRRRVHPMVEAKRKRERQVNPFVSPQAGRALVARRLRTQFDELLDDEVLGARADACAAGGDRGTGARVDRRVHARTLATSRAMP